MVTPFIRGAGKLIRRAIPSPWPWSAFTTSRGAPMPPRAGARRSPGFDEFVEQPEFESLFSPSLPFVGPATPSVGRSFPSAIVEPGNALPGVRRARPVLDPQDVQFVNPRLTPPLPALPLSRQTIPYAIEPPARPYVASGFETRISPSRVEGFDVPEYTPLQPAQIMQVNEAAAADPIGTVAQSIEILDSAADAQQFGRSLEIASIARSRLGTSDEAFLFNQMLDDAVRRNARRFGIDENDIDPILYTNSRQLPDERAAESFGSRGERQDWAAARTDSEKFETDTRKVIKETRRVDDLDDLDTRNNGAIYRALAAGEINAEQAKRLIDQVNYRRVRLLQDKGTLPKNIKNNTKDKEGVRGIGLLVPSVLRGSDAQKAAIYKAAIQTSESSEELAQVYSIARADVTSPEYLDVIEDALNAKTSILGQIEGVSAPRLPSVGRSTIDEGSVASANRAQRELDVARAEADRPENQGPIVRSTTYNPETKRFEEQAVGTVSSRRYTVGESENIEGYLMGRPVSPDAFEASTAAPPSEKVFVRGVGYSKRNEPLSALRMKLKDGRTIEEAYQLDVKGYRELADSNSEWAGQPWKKWMEGKGKPTLNGQTPEELDAQYTDLWRTWFRENPTELDVAAREIGNRPINDMFASPGSVSQSKSVHEVLVENGVRYTGEAAPAKPSLIKNPQLAKRVGNLDSSDSNQVFVFGSNLEGVHGAGAARTATDTWGAQQGVGKGLTGRAYAFPTKRVPSRQGRQLSLEELSENFRELFDTAASNPDKQFMVSPVGTGLGGYRVDEIAELIARYDVPANVKFVDTTTEEAERFVMAIARAKSLRQA